MLPSNPSLVDLRRMPDSCCPCFIKLASISLNFDNKFRGQKKIQYIAGNLNLAELIRESIRARMSFRLESKLSLDLDLT